MDVDRIKVRSWSMLGKRGTYGTVLTELAPKCDNLIAMSADFTRSSGLERFSLLYPDKFINVGIAEQNLVGIASGLASEGYNVFASSFASFITTRSYEQIKIHCGYMNHNIKIIGLASGFGVQQQGNTHYGLDDICLMRAIPNMMIISPADTLEVAKAVEFLLEYNGPAYLRLCGEANDPIVFKEDYNFKAGEAIKLRDGSDIAIFATGTMVYQSLLAAKKLSDSGLECTVIDIHTIRPIDSESIARFSSGCSLIVTCEEGFITGGLASAVLEEIVKLGIKTDKVLNIGLTQFPHAGSYKYMLEQTGLDAAHIADSIIEKLNEQ